MVKSNSGPRDDYEIISRKTTILFFFRINYYVIKRIRHWRHLDDEIEFYDHDYKDYSNICWNRDLSRATHFINYNKVCRILNKFTRAPQLPGWNYEVVFSTNQKFYQIQDPLEERFKQLESQ